MNRGPASHRFIGGESVGDSVRIASSYKHWMGEAEGYADENLELELTTRSLEPRIVVIEVRNLAQERYENWIS
jgi:hypothetical protein